MECIPSKKQLNFKLFPFSVFILIKTSIFILNKWNLHLKHQFLALNCLMGIHWNEDKTEIICLQRIVLELWESWWVRELRWNWNFQFFCRIVSKLKISVKVGTLCGFWQVYMGTKVKLKFSIFCRIVSKLKISAKSGTLWENWEWMVIQGNKGETEVFNFLRRIDEYPWELRQAFLS